MLIDFETTFTLGVFRESRAFMALGHRQFPSESVPYGPNSYNTKVY